VVGRGAHHAHLNDEEVGDDVLELLGDEASDDDVDDQDLAEQVFAECRKLDRKADEPVTRDGAQEDLMPVRVQQ
jgi:hypothetical protein